MTYDELCVDVLEAMEKMEELKAVPKHIYLSPSAFNVLAEQSPNRPMFMGLTVHVENLGRDQQFVITQGGEKHEHT